jgi:O-acetyl-ADP-ribose deacetylase (regulator of RNase III)
MRPALRPPFFFLDRHFAMRDLQDLRFILCDPRQELCHDWDACIKAQLTAEQQARFTVFCGPLSAFKGNFDCIVSPGNAYARLDGAFDLVISQMVCPQKPEAVVAHCQAHLQARHNGYQPPGTCLLIPVSVFNERKRHCRYIAHCPTMRVPSDSRWNKEIPYNCMWSLIDAITQQNDCADPIRSVFVTGLGTGVGRFPAKVCASQMILAYRHFAENLQKRQNGEFSTSTSWAEAYARSLEIDDTLRCIEFFA